MYAWKNLHLGTFVLMIAFTSSALGQEPRESSEPGDAPEDLEAAAKARRHFEKAMELYNHRDYRPAIREFQLAASLTPSPDLWFNIARSHEKLGEYDEAIDYYRRYLRDRMDPPDRQQVEDHIEELQARVKAAQAAQRARPETGIIRVRMGNTPGKAMLDGEPLAGRARDSDVRVQAGNYPFVVEHEGSIPFRSSVVVPRGASVVAYPTLTAQKIYRAQRRPRVWTWVVAAGAGIALAAATGFAVQSRLRKSDDFAASETWATRSDYALGAGLGLGVAAAVVYFLEGRAVDTQEARHAAVLTTSRGR